ncbi:MAG: hypothetical protein NDI61_01145 [Bdellovibrionaceae bacterium]|nr:hypothetical protein [Pseudobdellovibrionaceae bacterium]
MFFYRLKMKRHFDAEAEALKPKQRTHKKGLTAPPDSHVPAVPSPLEPVSRSSRSRAAVDSRKTSGARGKSDQGSQEPDDRRKVALFLIVGALLLAGIAFFMGEQHGRRSSREMLSLAPQERSVGELMSSRRPLTFEERVRIHRNQVGDALNRQRIRAQYDNLGLPNPKEGSAPYQADPIMNGLPLDGQRNQYSTLVPSPSRPRESAELDVQKRVQLAKDLDAWEQSAREEYIRQFKANARAQGFEVHIDADYNVEWQPIERSPQSTSNGGGVQ